MQKLLQQILTHYKEFTPSYFNIKNSTTTPTDFILYGSNLNLEILQKFTFLCDSYQKMSENFIFIDAYIEYDLVIILFKGTWQEKWKDYAKQLNIDIAKLDFDAILTQPGLLVMDMDSTMIKMECIDEVAKLAGTGEEVSKITASAMRGELDFEQSLRARVATLENAPETILQTVRTSLPFMPGLESMIQSLKKYHWKFAIASGGFTYFADFLKNKFNLDFAISNQFEIINGKLTGNVKGDVIDAQYKAKTLCNLSKKYNIPMVQTVAIGDGANDLPMLAQANLGAAFHAKPKVQQQAQVVVNFADLRALLCLLHANEKRQQLTNTQ